MTTKLKNRMPELKKLAASMNCTVTDNRDATTIEVEANEGWSWDEGMRSCQWTSYGSEGSYKPEWRHDAIAETIIRLTENPPSNEPFIGDD